MKIEEIGGDRYSNLEEAWEAGGKVLTDLLVEMVEQGIKEGRYVIKNGIVKLAEEEQESHGED